MAIIMIVENCHQRMNVENGHQGMVVENGHERMTRGWPAIRESYGQFDHCNIRQLLNC